MTFTSHGGDVFSKLTQDNVNACPGDPSLSQTANCAGRHCSIWLDLTQKDIDNWKNPDYVGSVSRPWDAPQNATDPTPKFLTDPITQEQITGGQAVISGSFTQATANELAPGIYSGSLPVTLLVLVFTPVGSTLGAESVELGLGAGMVGQRIVVTLLVCIIR